MKHRNAVYMFAYTDVRASNEGDRSNESRSLERQFALMRKDTSVKSSNRAACRCGRFSVVTADRFERRVYRATLKATKSNLISSLPGVSRLCRWLLREASFQTVASGRCLLDGAFETMHSRRCLRDIYLILDKQTKFFNQEMDL